MPGSLNRGLRAATAGEECRLGPDLHPEGIWGPVHAPDEKDRHGSDRQSLWAPLETLQPSGMLRLT